MSFCLNLYHVVAYTDIIRYSEDQRKVAIGISINRGDGDRIAAEPEAGNISSGWEVGADNGNLGISRAGVWIKGNLWEDKAFRRHHLEFEVGKEGVIIGIDTFNLGAVPPRRDGGW
ncbi:hypothetical protein ES703_59231 [subsurface metagenome]